MIENVHLGKLCLAHQLLFTHSIGHRWVFVLLDEEYKESILGGNIVWNDAMYRNSESYTTALQSTRSITGK